MTKRDCEILKRFFEAHAKEAIGMVHVDKKILFNFLDTLVCEKPQLSGEKAQKFHPCCGLPNDVD